MEGGRGMDAIAVSEARLGQAGAASPRPLLFGDWGYWWSGPGINVCLADIDIAAATMYAQYKFSIMMNQAGKNVSTV